MNEDLEQRLGEERNLWVATARPDGRPHLTPVWFAFWDGRVYICISSNSVKARNLASNPGVAFSLEDGVKPLIGEGQAEVVETPWPEVVATIFQDKYAWDILDDADYDLLVAIRPRKWLAW